MNKRLFSYFILALLFLSLIPFIETVKAPANSNNTLGYEFLDSGAVVRIWNNFDSYYFNVSNGIQFTNHYQEYWTHNVMMIGYYAADTWNLLYRTDELSGFEKTIDLTETYCNATLWKDLTYAGYSFRLAIRYCLGVNDINLTVIPYIKNLGIDIPYQLAFGWEMKDIQVDGNIENDYIKINDTQYFLNQPLDNTYTGLADSRFYLVDDTHSSLGGKVLYLDWDSSLDYLVQVKSRSGQYNAPVTLFVKVGTLTSGQEKYTKMYWWDSSEDLTTFTEHDAGNYFSETTTTCSFTNLPKNADNHTVYKDYGAGYFSGNQIFNFEAQFTSSTAYTISNAVIWMLSNKLDDWLGQLGQPHYCIVFERNSDLGGALSIFLERDGAADYCNIDVATLYYLTVTLNNTNVILNIYTDSARTVLHNTLSITRTADTFKYLFVGASYYPSSDAATCTGFMRLLDMDIGIGTFNITTYPASNVKATDATLNGIVATGNQTAQMRFKYGFTLAYGTYTTYQSCPANTTQNYSAIITGLIPGKLYHYRANGYNTTKTINGTDKMFLTKPEAPTGITYTTVSPAVTNISWVKGTGSNRTVIVKKTGSVPTNYSDGTEIYNNTGTYYLYTTSSNEFIQMWSYTKWINGSVPFYQYSDNSSIYAVFVNCYNESSSQAIANFSVFFTNPLGTQTYAHDHCNNPHAISVSNVPLGNDISLLVNATGYYSRTYVMDIIITGNYYINAYLVPITAALYYLRVVETIESSYSPYDQAVEGATVTVKRYINASVGYQTVSSLLTDANGYANLQLLPFIQYKVFISKTGYDDKISDYIPAPPNEWGQTVEKVFRIVKSIGGYTNITTFSDAYDFYATMHTNNTINIICQELIAATTNAQFYIYGTYNTSVTFFSSYSYTGTLNANIWIPGINTSRLYIVILYVNHTLVGYSIQTLWILPIANETKINGTWLEKKITDYFGNWNLGYVNTGLLFIPAICLIVIFGAIHQAGLGLFLSGAYLGGILKFVQFDLGTTAKMGMLCGLFIVMGILLIIAKRKGWFD